MDVIELDGSFGEGGGAMLRQSLALSMLTGKPFRINNIRMGRCNPGLAPQHLCALNTAFNICGGEVSGNFIGSTEVFFKPGEFKAGHHKISIGTAGSITLLIQSLLLPSIFCGKRVSFQLEGGTDVKWSQPFDYFNNVFLPQISRYADVEARLFRRGYYPKGGGQIKLVVNSKKSLIRDVSNIEKASLDPLILLNQKALLQIKGISHASINLEDSKVAERQCESARINLKGLNVPFTCDNQYSNSLSTGSGLTLWAVFGEKDTDVSNPVVLGADSLGDKGKKAEAVGLQASNILKDFITSGAPVDSYLADQLVPLMAVTGGIIKASAITDHVKSNIYVAEKFLSSKFDIKEGIISCSKEE